MMTTTILLFHPDLSASRANAALAAAAPSLPGVEVVDVQALDPVGTPGGLEREVRRLLRADRLVLQFPLYWYSTPPLLKAWQDAVLTRMMYVAYESEGRVLAGLPVMVAVTTGGPADAYGAAGRTPFTLDQLLAPLRATAHRCAMQWHEPFTVYGASSADDATLATAAAAYRRHLTAFAAVAA